MKTKTTAHPDLWEATKAAFRGKCIAPNIYIRKEDLKPMASGSSLRN